MDARRTENEVSLQLISFYCSIFLCSMSVCSMSVSFAEGQTIAPAPLKISLPSRSYTTGIQKVEFSLEKLREVNEDLKRMMKSVKSLNDEVTIQPMSLVTQPEAVAGNIINLPVAVQGTGAYMPARKEKVNQAMSSLKPMVADMKASADAFVSTTNQINLSIPVSAEITPLLKEWIEVVHRVSKEEQRLEQLTVGPSYDNPAIARIAGFIQEDIKKLELNRREMVKAIRKQEKVESKRSQHSQIAK
jgi:hypothetical protein